MPILNMIAQGGGGGSNVGEPTNLSASATSNTSIEIKWTDNNLQAIPPSTFQKSVLVRKVGSAPTTPSDGTTVVTETVMNTYQSSAYSDTGLTQGTTYYYQVFSYSTDGGITYGTPVSATPQGRWQPGVNTYIYYPFTSDLVDVMGNGNTGVMSGTCTFNANTGIYVNGENRNYITGLSNGVGGMSTFTVNVRCKYLSIYQNDIGYILGYVSSGSQSFNICSYGGYIQGMVKGNSEEWINLVSRPDTNWHNIVCTGNGDGTYTWYVDGASIETSQNIGTLSNVSVLQLGWGGSYGVSRSATGYIKDYIVETVARTAQEISDYYDQTKANYGL